MTTRLRTFAALPAALVLAVSFLTACNDTAEPASTPSETTMMKDETMTEGPTESETMMEDETMTEDTMTEDTMEDEG